MYITCILYISGGSKGGALGAGAPPFCFRLPFLLLILRS